jgi:nitroreductase
MNPGRNTMDRTAATDHPIHELFARRWSPRALAPKPVPAALLRSLLEAARWAASAFNEQPWRFIVARREDEDEFDTMLDCLVEGNRTWARNAGVLILTAARATYTHNDRPNRHAWHDLGQAAAHMALQATELGLVVHQMAGILPDKARQIYGVPDGYDVVTGIAVGYPGDPGDLPEALREMETSPRKRKPQAETVYRGAWDRRADW